MGHVKDTKTHTKKQQEDILAQYCTFSGPENPVHCVLSWMQHFCRGYATTLGGIDLAFCTAN